MTRPFTRGAVAGGHPATAAAGAEMLRAGGNAVDAAIAAIWASFVSEAILGSPAGGGFMTLHDPVRDMTLVYDFFSDVPGRGGRAPIDAAATGDLDFVIAEIEYGPTRQAFRIGHGSVAVPGALLGLWQAHRRHGRLPPHEVLAPAIRLCREGAEVTEGMARIFEVLAPIILHTAGSRALFAPGGVLLRAGELFRNPDLADTLELLARDGPRSFYRGEIAAEMAHEFGPRTGGLLTPEDLRGYRVARRPPLFTGYRGREIVMNPAPSSGGPLIDFSLRLLARCDPGGLALATERRLRLLAEIMAATNRARVDMAAPEWEGDPSERLEQAWLEVERALEGKAGEAAPEVAGAGRGSTTHVSALDEEGGAAAITVSNGESCGAVLPGRGLLMNNFLGEEDINPLGFHRAPPGERMSSMMCPTLLMESGRPVAALGTGGANRIRSAILQTLVNLIDLHLEPHEAVAAARMHFEHGRLALESWELGLPVLESLRRHYPDMAVFPTPSMFFGGVNLTARRPEDGVVIGVGDARRSGAVALVE